MFGAREDVSIRLPYLIRIGNVGGNPISNTLFATISTGSGWFMGSSSLTTITIISGTYLYVSRTDVNYINFFEV